MLETTTIPALVSHAASAKPCVPHNDAQRRQGESNSDHQHEITLTSFNHWDHNLTTALGNPLNKYLSQHMLNNDSTIIEFDISGHTQLLRLLGYYSAHPERG